MKHTVECEIYITINEDGDWAMATDPSDAIGILRDDYGGEAFRTIKILAYVDPPEITEVKVDVPDEAGETQRAEAQAS